MANNALVLVSKGASLELQDRAIPTPGPNQIVVKNNAVAINFINNLMLKFGFMVPSYPCVIGSDVSGVVCISNSCNKTKQELFLPHSPCHS